MNLTPDVFLPAGGAGRNPWAPRPGLMLSGAGQCTETIHAMQRMQGDAQKPVIIALYEGISDGAYHQNPDIFEAHTLFPGAILQIGLQLPLFSTEGLMALANGEWADAAAAMADGYRRIGLPILLRIGYEFDGVKWNGYDPAAYRAAYRYIARVLAEAGAHNVALVWDSYTTDTQSAMDWFPGEDVVDWYGYNTLAPKFSGPNLMRDRAQAAGKPLMNGEASYAEGVGDMTFADWAQGYFRSMREAGVAAYQYINWRWQVYPGAANWSHWADGRITDDAAMAAAYVQAMQGEDMVYRDETYAQPLMLTIDCARALTDTSPDAPWEARHDHVTTEAGYGYSATGVTSAYGSGWGTAWRARGSCAVRLAVPGAFAGECVLRVLADGPLTLTVNGMKARWEAGRGHLHIPVHGQDTLDIAIESPDGGEFAISHVYLLETRPSALSPTRTAGGFAWAAADGALYYHVYRDCLLWDITAEAAYSADMDGHAWHVAAYDAHGGVSAMEEVAG